MRSLSLVLIASAVGSCMAGPPNPEVIAREQAQLANLTAGKVAGPPISCLPSYRSNDMVVVNDSTIAFRQGSSRVYINHMQGGCTNVGQGSNALVTRTPGPNLCRGDIAQVVDFSSRTPVGSCVFGDFVPFTRPRG
jgi:hypothetical protein